MKKGERKVREYTVLNPTLTVREDDEVPGEWSRHRERKKKNGETKGIREKERYSYFFLHKNTNVQQLGIDSIITDTSCLIIR